MSGPRHVADIAAAVGLDPVVYRRGEVETRVGLSHDDMVRWWRAMGFAEVPEDEVAFSDDDIRMATSLTTLLASGTVQERDVLRLARVLGASFSRIAEAQVSLLDDNVHDQVDNGTFDEPTQVGTPAEESGDVMSTAEVLELLEEAIVYVWRRHLVAAFGRRLRFEDAIEADVRRDAEAIVGSDRPGDDAETSDEHIAQDPHGVRASTVGFVDIAGFSKLSKQLGADELADLVDAFEASALEVAAVNDARVVKFIGDAAMFVADDLATGVRVGLELQAQARAGDSPVELHCGVAHGPAITMGGDVFGPTVNLASRLTDVARRNTVAVPRDCVPELAEHDDLVVRNVRRPYDLKGIGRTRISVVSRAEVPDPLPEADPEAEQTSDEGVEVVVEFPLEDPSEEPERPSKGEDRRQRRERLRRERSAD